MSLPDMTDLPAASEIKKLISSSELTVTVARPGAVALKVIPAPPVATVPANLLIAELRETLNVPEPPVPSFRTATPVALSSPTPSERLLS